MPWRIEFEGEVYREGDLTLEQIGKVERLTDKSWLHIQPIRFAGDAIAVLAVMVNARKNEEIDKVISKVGALKPGDYIEMIHVDDDHDLPAEYQDGFPPVADESTGT